MHRNRAQAKFVFMGYRSDRNNAVRRRQNQVLMAELLRLKKLLDMIKLVQQKRAEMNPTDMGMVETDIEQYKRNNRNRKLRQFTQAIRSQLRTAEWTDEHKDFAKRNGSAQIFESRCLMDKSGLMVRTTDIPNKSIKAIERLIPMILFVERILEKQTDWLKQMCSKNVGNVLDIFQTGTRTAMQPAVIS